MEIIYGAAVIDHDRQFTISAVMITDRMVYIPSLDMEMPCMWHELIRDRPGLQIFNVFEGGASVPYGYALRDAKTAEVYLENMRLRILEDV